MKLLAARPVASALRDFVCSEKKIPSNPGPNVYTVDKGE